jgi:hypothetical protein
MIYVWRVLVVLAATTAFQLAACSVTRAPAVGTSAVPRVVSDALGQHCWIRSGEVICDCPGGLRAWPRNGARPLAVEDALGAVTALQSDGALAVWTDDGFCAGRDPVHPSWTATSLVIGRPDLAVSAGGLRSMHRGELFWEVAAVATALSTADGVLCASGTDMGLVCRLPGPEVAEVTVAQRVSSSVSESHRVCMLIEAEVFCINTHDGRLAGEVVRIQAPGPVVSLAAADSVTCALTANGTLWCFGEIGAILGRGYAIPACEREDVILVGAEPEAVVRGLVSSMVAGRFGFLLHLRDGRVLCTGGLPVLLASGQCAPLGGDLEGVCAGRAPE